MASTEELLELIEKWRKRRDRLGKKASDINRIKNLPNQLHAQYFLGEFSEIEKCRGELVTIVNRIIKKNNAAILKKISEE